MSGGKIVQQGSPRSIYRDPSCAFVADFIGSTNLLRGQIESKGTGDGAVVIWQGDRLRCAAPQELSSGDPIALSIRPGDVRISDVAGGSVSGENTFKGSIVENSFLGSINDYVVAVKGSSFRVWTSPDDVFEIGSDVVVRLPAAAISSFRDDPSYASRQLR
jgi:iron(III) transport system ATP-binding protein